MFLYGCYGKDLQRTASQARFKSQRRGAAELRLGSPRRSRELKDKRVDLIDASRVKSSIGLEKATDYSFRKRGSIR